uniref:Mic1 domain-containing protein n=1 Tax=Peronospora matthiolae TaxID=2874970 RepID=A0AAV1U524_9STRA
MELDQSISLWRGRAVDAALLGASSCMSKDGNRLVLLTSTEDVREICAPTRKCTNHWTFRAGSLYALRVTAVRHPHSRLFFGVCGAPGVSASKKARQVRRQEVNKTTALPANEGLTVWRDVDTDVAAWRRTPLQSSAKAFAVLAHLKLKEEVVVVFQDGSFATYDEELNRGVHSDDAKDATVAEEEEEVEGIDMDGGDEDAVEDARKIEEDEARVVWAYVETDSRSSSKGGLFLSILVQKLTQEGNKQLELMVYQITCPTVTRRMGGVLSVVLRVRHRVRLPDDEELSSCAFHPETFSYSLIGRSGSWQTLRFSRDAVTSNVTLVACQRMPSLTSAEGDANVPVHKKRKLQAANRTESGYLVSGIGHVTYLVSLSLDAPSQLTAWDSKFAVPVSKSELNLTAEKDSESGIVIGRSSKDGVGRPVQIVNVGSGDVLFVIYERGVFLIHVRNKKSTLASVLGATASSGVVTLDTLASSALPDSCVQWESIASSSMSSDTLVVESWQSKMCSDDDRERQLIADLSDPQVASSAAAFIERLDKALEKQKSEQKPGKEEQEELSFRLLQAVTRRCLESPELGLWAPLKKMLLTGRLSARTEPTLLPILMKYNQFALLECAIVHLIDIDERSIVRLLMYCIRKSSDLSFIEFVEQQVQSQHKQAAGRIDATAVCERFTVALLGLPTNSVFLHRAIRELKLEEVLLVLAICKKLLLVHTTGADADDDVSVKTRTRKSKTGRKSADLALALRTTEEQCFTPLPSASRCCVWICALLDAHLSALVHRASRNIAISRTLHQLDALVQLLIRTNAHYESVHGVLSNFLSGVRLPRAPGLPDYSMEELWL